jgi:hypothetical protein
VKEERRKSGREGEEGWKGERREVEGRAKRVRSDEA